VSFSVRYFDYLFGWTSSLRFMIKTAYILLVSYTVYLMKVKKPYRLSLDRESDLFPHYYLYGAALLAAILIHKSLHPLDFLWSFGIWL
jgi:hypothetical protein